MLNGKQSYLESCITCKHCADCDAEIWRSNHHGLIEETANESSIHVCCCLSVTFWHLFLNWSPCLLLRIIWSVALKTRQTTSLSRLPTLIRRAKAFRVQPCLHLPGLYCNIASKNYYHQLFLFFISEFIGNQCLPWCAFRWWAQRFWWVAI